MPIIKARSSSIISSVDLRGTPTVATAAQGVSTTQIASTAFVRNAVTALVDAAPETLDTLNELAAALGDDPNFAATVTTALGTKLALAGGTMTGSLILSGDPTADLEAATKQYVDYSIAAITLSSLGTTDDMVEGVTNLYFTEARARSSISLDSDNTDVLDYNATTGAFSFNWPTTDGLLEGVNNLFYTTSRVRNDISLNSDDQDILSYSSTTGGFTFNTPDTDKISEGSTNLYFTTARARNAISAGSNINYDPATGIISSLSAVESVNGMDGVVVLDTDDIGEGTTNLYFTNTRARAAISLTSSDTDTLSYNGVTGAFTYVKPNSDGIAEGVTNLYFTNARVRSAISVTGDLTYNSETGVLGFSLGNHDTDDLAEGATNLYYTDARVHSAISLTSDTTDVMSYDAATGAFAFTLANVDTDEIVEGSSNLYFTTARARDSISVTGWQISYNSGTGVITMATPTTTNVAEGTNLYYTDTRARSAVSLTSSNTDVLSYNSATGVFTFDLAAQTTDDVAEGLTNLYYTDERVDDRVSNLLVAGDGITLSYDDPAGTLTIDTYADTDGLTEGSTNLYFTTQRARDSVSAVDAGGDGSFSYDSATGAFTYTGPSASEVRAHLSATSATGVTYDSATGVIALSAIPNSSLTNSSVTINSTEIALGGSATFSTTDIGEGTNLYYTDARARAAISATGWQISYNNTTGVITMATPDTDDVAEGLSNLYFTDARARGAISVSDAGGDGSMSYDSATGVITYTGPSATEVRAHLSATSATGVTYDSATGVIALSAIPNSSLTNSSVTFNGTTVALGGTGSFDTDAVTEGTSNLYFTNARAQAAISVSGDLTYAAGVVGFALADHDTDDLAEGATNLYFTQARARGSVSLTSDTADVLSYNSTTGAFTFTLANVDTDEVAEGSSNLYFTTARARESISASGNLSYDSATGVISFSASSLTTDDIAEGTTNLYFTDERVDDRVSNLLVAGDNITLTYDDAAGTLTVDGPTSTTEIGEGTNLYFTTQRARDSVSAVDAGGDGSFSYDSATGAFTYTGPSATEVRAHLSATSATGVTYDSATGVIALSAIPNASLTNDSVTFNGTTVALGGTGSFDTDAVTEGTSNLYFTNGRARSAISLVTDNADALSYNATTGAFTFDLSSVNSDEITEGATNLYFTPARVRQQISVSDLGGDGSLSYDNTTGVISYTGPSAAEVRAHFTAGTGIAITDGTIATSAVPNASLVNDSVTFNGTTVALGGTGSFDTDAVTEGTSNLYFTNARARGAVSVSGDLTYDSATGVFGFALADHDTDDLAEGTTNLYFTNARVRAAISAVDAGGDGSFSYDSATGAFTYTGPSATEVRAHLSATSATGVTYDSATGVIALSAIPNSSLTNSSLTVNGTTISLGGSGSFDTDAVTEGTTNLYHTTARVRAAISATGDLSYNSTTGVIDFSESVNSVNGQTGAVVLDTDDVAEGTTNLYYTDARAQAAITGGTGVDVTGGVVSIGQAVETTSDVTFNDVTVSGDLTVNGTLTTINSTDLTVTDKNITIADGAADAAAADGAGITVDGADATITYLSGTDTWNFNKTVVGTFSGNITGNVTGDVTGDVTGTVSDISNHSTTDLAEGTNLYFTDARARSAISLTTDNTDALSYDSATGAFTFDLSSVNSDEITEGATNLYFTPARVRQQISVSDLGGDGSLSYDSATGVISYTGPSAAEVRAHFTAGTGIAITDGTIATSAVPNSSLVNSSVTFNGTTVALGGTGSFDTDSVSEGTSNLYFTDARAQAAISVSGDLTYAAGVVGFALADHDTDDLAEGTTNLYFTDARAQAAISAVDAGGDGSLSYDSATGVITYTGPSATEVRAHLSATTATGVTYDSATGVIALSAIPNTSLTNSAVTFNGTTVSLGGSGSFDTDAVTEGTTNLYFTDARARGAMSVTGDLTYNSTTGAFGFALADHNTDDLAEGTTNLYFTNARVRGAISAVDAGGDGSFSYDSATGAFTYTGPSAAEVRAHLSATSATGVTYDSATGVIALSAIPNSSLTNSSLTVNGTTISLGGSGSFDTDAVSEGTSNLYFTDERVDDRVAALLQAGDNITLTYDDAAGTLVIDGPTSTTEIAEGTNLYFTDARAQAAISVTDAGGDGSLSYDSATGVITYTGPSAAEVRAHFTAGTGIDITDGVVSTSAVPNSSLVNSSVTFNGTTVALGGTGSFDTDAVTEGTTNLYYTDARAQAAISVSGDLTYAAGVVGFALADHDTDDLAEGTTNLYHTTARVRAAISAVDAGGDGSFSYDSATGAFTYTGPSASEVRAHLSATTATGVTYDSATGIIALASIPNSSLTNSSVTFNGTTVALGGSASFDTDSVAEGTTNLYYTDERVDDRIGTMLTAGDNITLTYDDEAGTMTIDGPTSTTEIAEGTNLYYTDTRARASISVSDTGGDGSLSYDNTTGVITYTGPSAAEVRAHFSATTATGVTLTDGVIALASIPNSSLTNSSVTVNGATIALGGSATLSTTDIGEGTNLYYTDARARNAVSLTSDDTAVMSYDSATGEFTFSLASSTTDSVAEGVNNLYYTDERVDDRIADLFVAGDNITLTYDDVANTFTIDGPTTTTEITEGTNLYYTDARVRAAISLTTNDAGVMAYDAATGAFTFDSTGLNTDEITEGSTNLYFTEARARDSISVSGDLTYNSGTGVIGFALANHNTDDLAEGLTNKYYTDTRVRNAISLTTDNTDAMSYNATTGVFTFSLATVDTDEIAEGATNLYFTTARARSVLSVTGSATYDSATGIIDVTGDVSSVNGQTGVVVLDTDNIDEGSANLYFTDARARAALTVTSDDTNVLSYNTATGVLTYTKPDTDAIAEGSTNLYYTNARVDARIEAASVFDLSDVNSGSMTDGYTLVWSAADSAFVPQNISVTATTLTFTGDGSTTSFNTGVEISSIENTTVFINGLVQAPTYSYTISTDSGTGETSIVFDSAPETNDYVMVRVTSTSQLTAGGVLNESSTIDGGTY